MRDNSYYGSLRSEWPFPIKYDVENRIETDVLVIGGGVSGGMAGLMAARRGVRVAVVDKAPIEISGNGGAGLDHYGACTSNPDSPLDLDELIYVKDDKPRCKNETLGMGYDHRGYVNAKGAWDNLMVLEELGLKFRDENDDFAGAPFRDEKTKILYAYDYWDKTTIRIRGGINFKKVIKDGLAKNENVRLFERVMITTLLTEDGRAGSRAVGAVGISEETGEFYVFSAKSVILCTANVSAFGTGTWTFNSEMFGNGFKAEPRCTGDGCAMAWRAGAEFTKEEQFGDAGHHSPFGWLWYGIGTSDNTWHPATLVDNNGKQIPWRDGNGDPITTVAERTLPPRAGRAPTVTTMHIASPYIDPQLIRNGEYELPLWADLTELPWYERRGIWGLMIGNEGRTRQSIYNYFNRSGFNPEKDMLQVPVMDPENYESARKDWYQGEPNNNKFWKSDTLRGVNVDWNHMTSVDGLFAAGAEIGQAGAACGSSGAFAGNRAAEFAMQHSQGKVCESQIAAEKERIYAPVRRMDDPQANVSWKELWMGMNRVMQQDCGNFRTKVLCEHGLKWLDSIRHQEMRQTYARNPHELSRVLEVENRMYVAEIYLYLAIANFTEEEKGACSDKLMYTKLIDGELITTYKEQEWWLKPPYASTYLENYEKCRALETKSKASETEVQ